MERRRFIGCAAAAAPLLGSVAVAQGAAEPTEKAKKRMGRKIMVVRRSVHKDLAAKWPPGYDVKPCEVTHEGQELFVDSPWNPQGDLPMGVGRHADLHHGQPRRRIEAAGVVLH
jgi:hypothetical protein